MAQDVYIAPPPPRQPRNWSCCLWGCLIAFIFLILITIALVLVGRSTLTALRENWTSPEPQELPTLTIEEPALDELVARVDAFADHVEHGEPSAPLVLSQDEINALIQHHPDWRDLHDKVYVEIEDGLIKGRVNFPLDGIPLMSGRYFHGTATFDVGLEDGRLEVYVDSAEVNGEPLPDEFMAAIRQENLAQEYTRDNAEAREIVDRLESIRIEDDKLVITPKLVLEDVDAGTRMVESIEDAAPMDVAPVSPDAEATVEQPEDAGAVAP